MSSRAAVVGRCHKLTSGTNVQQRREAEQLDRHTSPILCSLRASKRILVSLIRNSSILVSNFYPRCALYVSHHVPTWLPVTRLAQFPMPYPGSPGQSVPKPSTSMPEAPPALHFPRGLRPRDKTRLRSSRPSCFVASAFTSCGYLFRRCLLCGLLAVQVHFRAPRQELSYFGGCRRRGG
jgi:hypothetical protein